jgi:hypothetical protein
MHKRARSWNNWLGWTVLLSFVAGGAGFLISSQRSTAGRESLKNDVSELKSQAGVARLLSEQLIAGHVTRIFLKAQSEQLEKGVAKAREGLDPAGFAPELKGEVLRASDLALRLDQTLKALRESGGERGADDSLRKSFAELFSELTELEDGLKS